MKKILLSAMFIASAFTTISAQTEKGTFLIGAGSSNLGFSSLKSETKYDIDGFEDQDNGKVKSLEVALKGAYFFVDNIAVGVQIPLTSSVNERDDWEYKTRTIVFSPFVRAYLYDNGNVKPYLEGNIGFGGYKNETVSRYNLNGSPFNDERKGNLFNYGLSGGVGIFITPKIALDFQLGYVYTSLKDEDVDDVKNVVKGFQSSIGFSFFL